MFASGNTREASEVKFHICTERVLECSRYTVRQLAIVIGYMSYYIILVALHWSRVGRGSLAP